LSTYIEDKITPQLLADLYNRGLTTSKISEVLGIRHQVLSRLASRWFNEGILAEYFNTALHKLRNEISVAAIALNQRLNVLESIKLVKPIAVYFSPLPKPVYIAYFEETCTDLEEAFLERISHVALNIVHCGKVESSPRVFEEYVNYNLRLEILDDDKVIDDIDELIVKIYFQIFNPPPIGYHYRDIVLKSIEQHMKLSTYRNHFYRHVNKKAVWWRVLHRPLAKRYGILLVHSPSIVEAQSVILKLKEADVIVGVDQVNVISMDPFIGVVHAWVDEERLWSELHNHREIKYAKYELYLVKRLL